MKIYRLENYDGGGPFVTRDGYIRVNPKIKFNNDYIFGFISLEALNEWFKKNQLPIEQLNNLKLKIYEVSENDIKFLDNEECTFPKTYTPIN